MDERMRHARSTSRTSSEASERPMDRLDILYVISSLAVGGSERQLSALASRLAERGHRITIFCLYGAGPYADGPRSKGVTIIAPRRGPRGPVAGPLARLASGGALLVTVTRLFLLMLVKRPRIVHFFGPPAYLTGGLSAIAAGLRHRIFSRRSLNDYQLKRPRLARLEHRLHGRMSAVLGNSRAVTAQLLAEGVEPARLGLISNGIDLAPFAVAVDRATVRDSVGTGRRDLVIMILANLIPYKGHADLLTALAGIKDRLPPGWRLWIVGRDDGLGAALRQQATTLGVLENMRFLGARSDVPALLASADIAVSASHEEGFSNAVTEAMAAARPVVATAAGGNAEAVTDGVTGFVVPVRDGQAMGRALLTLALDPELARNMGAAGRERVARELGMEECVLRHERLYEAVLAGRPVAEALSTAPATPAASEPRAGGAD